MKDTQKDLDELRQRKAEEAEFSKLMSGTDPFKTLTYRVINLPFAEKYRLIRGVLDGPITVGHSTLIPLHDPETEDEIMKILDSCGMTVRYNQPLLLELLDEEHTTKSL